MRLSGTASRSPPHPSCDMETPRLDIQLPGFGELGALLDEAEARFGFGAHQAVDGGSGRRFIVEHLDPEQGALPRVHGGFLELRGHHFAEALEATDLDLAAAGELGLQELVLVRVVARVGDLAALAELIEG